MKQMLRDVRLFDESRRAEIRAAERDVQGPMHKAVDNCGNRV